MLNQLTMVSDSILLMQSLFYGILPSNHFVMFIIHYLSLAFLCVLRSTGLHGDLTFLLDEDLSSINLCSLHCEMQNCEQLLGSLGLFAHRVGSLNELTQALSDHGLGS